LLKLVLKFKFFVHRIEFVFRYAGRQTHDLIFELCQFAVHGRELCAKIFLVDFGFRILDRLAQGVCDLAFGGLRVEHARDCRQRGAYCVVFVRCLARRRRVRCRRLAKGGDGGKIQNRHEQERARQS